MDEFVKQKLEDWDLPQLNVIFEENEIDKETFLLLGKEEIKELLPKIGSRMKFVRNLEALRKEENSDMVTPEKRPASSLAVDDWLEKHSSSSSTGDCSLSSTSRLSISSPSTSAHSMSAGPSPKRTRVSGLMFSVREAIQKDILGNEMIAEIEAENFTALTAKYRKRMVQILVSNLIQCHGDRPSGDIKLQLAKEIITTFPRLKDTIGEGFESYYTPGSKNHPANGYLEIRLRNVRRSLGLSTCKEKPKNLASTESSSPITVEIENTLTDNECATMVAWLKGNRQPEAKVREYMKKTAPKRLAALKETDSLGSVLLEYPRLLDTPGMVEQDFGIMYPTKGNELYEKWEEKSAKIMEWALLQGNSWKKYLNLPNKITGEETTVAAFHLLPYILPTGIAFVGGSSGKRTKFSKSDSAKAFIDCQPVGTNIGKYIRDVEQEGSRKQPFVLVLGSRLAPEQHFMIVERVAVPQSSTIAAIDACFKAFFILNFEYPAACKAVWSFLQFGCYEVGSSSKASLSPSIRSLITASN